jgi:hypothetical protein
VALAYDKHSAVAINFKLVGETDDWQFAKLKLRLL